MAPQSTLHLWLFGGIGLLSISAVFYMFWFNTPKGQPLIKNGSDAKGQQESKESKVPTKDNLTKKPESKSAAVPDVVVEDADSDEDDEDEEEDATDAELEALKTQYEDANRLAQKYISGQAYAKAIEKLSEALDIAPKLPNAGKDLIKLYNNRSAMYEKLEMFEKSLSDITVVLAMEAGHMKARVRRARIFEAQGKLKQALDDYIYAGLMQQLMNEAPSHQAKVESIVKELAQKGADALFKTMRAATSSGARALPSKSHCKNFLESYPSMHLWAPHYRGQSRSVLEEALKEVTATADADAAQGADAEGAEGAAPDTSSIASPAERELQVRQHTLDLVCFDLVHNRFSDAFALLATLPLPAEEEPAAPDALDASYPLLFLSPFGETYRTNAQVLLSLQCELIGFDKHLRCDLTGAVAAYQRALRHYPNNIDARLKLANVYLEVPDLAATSAVFATLMAHYETLDKRSENVAIMMAWTLLHWVSVFVTRNEKGEYSPTAIADAQRDVDAALALTETVKHTVAGRAAAVTALVRSVHVLMQSKPMVGEPPAEDDAERCRELIMRAKAINPDSESVLLIEAEILNNEGDSDGALRIIQAVQRRPDAIENDCTFYCLRASILVNKAMTVLNTQGDMPAAQALFSEAGALYLQGMSLEPNAIELLNQYAQFSSMLGDVETAVRLLKAAIPMARTRDDVQDLNQLLIMNEAQLKAVGAIRGERQM